MIFGFNTDVKFGNTVYHVQSEARKHERLLQSQIFVKGRCIGKRATSYAEKEDQAGFTEEQLHELLKEQHKHFVEAVRAGRIEEELDADEPVPAVSAAVAAPGAAVVAPVPAAPPASAAPEPTADTAQVDKILAELRAAKPPSAVPDDELAAQFAAAVADKPADPGLALTALSGVIGKGLLLECLPPACTSDNSAVLMAVQVTEQGGAPASGAQVACRISVGQGPATYAYATSSGSGIADLRIALAGLNLADTNLLIQASYRGRSASRKYTLRRSN